MFLFFQEIGSKFKQRARQISREGLSELDQVHLDILEEHLGYFLGGFAYRK